MPILNNPRHEHFATLIASGLDPTNAYIAVGYSRKSAHASANRLQRNATVAARLTELKVAVAERTIEKAAVDRAWVISRLMSNVERCRQAEPVLDRQGNPTGHYRFDSTGANKALELLGRHLSMFVDRTEHTGADAGPVEVQARLERLSMEDLLKLQEIMARASAPDNNPE
jgi:phage terminase small subunit